MTIIPLPIPPETTKAMAEEALTLIKTFLGPSCKEAGEIAGDYVRFFRFERQVNLLRKAHQIVKEAGFNPKAVNMRVLFPLLDAAGLEDDETMSERWASLLVSATDSNNQSGLEVSFIEILKQLTPSHAYLLDVFYEQIARDKLPPQEWSERGYSISVLKDYLTKEVPDFDVAIENLFRLNLVGYPIAKLGIANGQEVRIHITSGDILCATHLGYRFVTACGHGRTERNISYGVPRNSISNIFWTRGGSLNITPAPPAKAIPPGPISDDLVHKIKTEILEIGKKIKGVELHISLVGRTLRVLIRQQQLQQLSWESLFPLTEYCAERDLKIEFSYGIISVPSSPLG